MFHIFVAQQPDAWDGNARTYPLERCFRYRGFTEPTIVEQFRELSLSQVASLLRYPCLFAHEAAKFDPKFGRLLNVRRDGHIVRIEFEIIPVSPFLTGYELREIADDLDTSDWQLGSTQWMIKRGNLAQLLRRKNIILPRWARTTSGDVDIDTHQFAVALSFPGTHRDYVESVKELLERRLGRDQCFYDRDYQAHLARPNMSQLLLDIYRTRSKLIVPFVGTEYQARDWCGLELRAIQEIILAREHGRIMYVRLDDGDVDGVLKTDGYIDARVHTPHEIADFIFQRVARLLHANSTASPSDMPGHEAALSALSLNDQASLALSNGQTSLLEVDKYLIEARSLLGMKPIYGPEFVMDVLREKKLVTPDVANLFKNLNLSRDLVVPVEQAGRFYKEASIVLESVGRAVSKLKQSTPPAK